MTTLSIFFTPQALARPSTRKVSPTRSSRNSKLKTKPLPSKSRPPPPPLSTAPLSGGDATTYTCLPTRDDFPFGHGPNGSSVVLKLSEVAVPSSLKNKSPLENVEYQEAISGSNDGGFDGNLEMNCASIDMIEGDSRSDDEEINGGGEVLNLEDRSSVNFSSSSVLNAGEESGSKEDEIENGFAGSDFFEEEEVKEKGVPAIMRCFDRAKIYVKSGDGGNGVVAFRREKHVQFGGPSGGDGGRGGNVYVEVDGAMNSLLPFRNNIHFRAGRGSNGQGSKQAGARGEDVIVKVPPGTVIREDGENGVQPSVVLELVNPGQRALLLPGGRGGKGNASFRSGTNKAPRIAEDGEEGPEMWMELELKLVADVGIVGAPNAGKSTLLSVISAAQPTVANYPFTTLLPNLGVVSFDYSSTMVVADLPGLLEGAHRGFGLGHEFLRHTERCSVLVHVVDGSGPQPEYEFDAIRLELELFNPKLAEKPFVVAYNKMDLPEAHEKWPTFKEKLEAQGIGPFCMSAVKKEGTHAVICAAYALLQKRKTFQVSEEWNPVNLNHVADKIRKEQTASIREFEISHDSGTNTWHVVGSGLQRFVQMTNWRYIDSEKRFQHVLEACGVNRSLLKRGVKEGDTVIVGGMELVWHDYPNNNSASDIKKSESSIRQPQ